MEPFVVVLDSVGRGMKRFGGFSIHQALSNYWHWFTPQKCTKLCIPWEHISGVLTIFIIF